MKNNKRTDNIFWGVLLVALALYIIGTQLGIMDGIGIIVGASLFDIILGVVFLVSFIKGIIGVKFGQIFFSAAFLGIIFDEQLNITAITPWTILFAALLLTIALNMIFPKRVRQHFGHTDSFTSASMETFNGENFNFKTTFGEASKYINSDNFLDAICESSFGDLNVYFENAIIQGSSATINVDVKFGDIKLYIPRNWQVNLNVSKSFGDARVHGRPDMDKNAKVININGNVSFGDLSINYI